MFNPLSSMYGSRGVALTSGSLGRVLDQEGREYVDWFTAHGAAIFGHGDPGMVQALQRAAEGLWAVGAGFGHPSRDALAEQVQRAFPGMRFVMCNSGTEAVEAALKFCAHLRPSRNRIIALRRGFHGRTLGALGLTFNPRYKEPFKGLVPSVEHLSWDMVPEAVDERVAAVFVEPVQGEGGVHPLPVDLGRAITDACRRSGAILVADEVQTGMGRCGPILASPLVGLKPQVVCLAKGLAGGFPCGMTLWESDLGDFSPGLHGSTYGGNPLACSMAAYGIQRVLEGASHGVCRIMECFRERVRGLGLAVRGLGSMTGVEVPADSSALVKALQDRGVLALAAGPRVVRFLPSFHTSWEDAELVLKALEGALSEACHGSGGAS
ncbi:MAG: aminotransferase class III-fold pyridoxal phosphate-dependent enzyme [Thermanaerothrix sp.]|nr:aminotransferase class III-fold pyridoxal phosphate-dependent enzyme [Thermanaerothrix sp.]